MSKIGIFFGTDTGTTRLVAKKIYSKLGEELADKPKNINRTSLAEFLAYDVLILGTPSYGVGAMPGLDVGCQEPNWAEFAPKLDDVDLSGKKIALFGLGHQERYADRFASSLIQLYRLMYGQGANMVGRWPIAGYEFKNSAAIMDNEFVGLVIDQRSQPQLTDSRIETWLEQVVPVLVPQSAQAA